MTTNSWQAYHPRSIKNDDHWFALCTIEQPNGTILTEMQFGTSELTAVTSLNILVRFKYDCTINQHRIPQG